MKKRGEREKIEKSSGFLTQSTVTGSETRKHFHDMRKEDIKWGPDGTGKKEKEGSKLSLFCRTRNNT